MSIAERPMYEWNPEEGFEPSGEHGPSSAEIWRFYGHHAPTHELPESHIPTQPNLIQPTEPLAAQRNWGAARTGTAKRQESRAARDTLHGQAAAGRGQGGVETWAQQGTAPADYSRQLAASLERHYTNPGSTANPQHPWRGRAEIAGVGMGYDRSSYDFKDPTPGPSMLWAAADVAARGAVRGALRGSAAIDDRRARRAQREPAAGREVNAIRANSRSPRVRDMTAPGSTLAKPVMTTTENVTATPTRSNPFTDPDPSSID